MSRVARRLLAVLLARASTPTRRFLRGRPGRLAANRRTRSISIEVEEGGQGPFEVSKPCVGVLTDDEYGGQVAGEFLSHFHRRAAIHEARNEGMAQRVKVRNAAFLVVKRQERARLALDLFRLVSTGFADPRARSVAKSKWSISAVRGLIPINTGTPRGFPASQSRDAWPSRDGWVVGRAACVWRRRREPSRRVGRTRGRTSQT